MAKPHRAFLLFAGVLLSACSASGPHGAGAPGAAPPPLAAPLVAPQAGPRAAPTQPATPVAGYRLAPPQGIMEPLPTGIVLLTDTVGRGPANQAFCESFFTRIKSADAGIEANENVVQIFWPTLRSNPGRPPAPGDDTAAFHKKVAAWCTTFLSQDDHNDEKDHYDYGRAARYLAALHLTTTQGPVFLLTANGDLRHPDLVLDSGRADDTQVAGLAERIQQAAAGTAPNAEPMALTVAAHAAPRRVARAAPPRPAPAAGAACTATITVTSNADGVVISSDAPVRCPAAALAASTRQPAGPAPSPAAAGAPAGLVEAVVNLSSADTNPTMQHACDFLGVVLPFVDDVPGIGLGGKIFDVGVCHNGFRTIYQALRAGGRILAL